MLFAQTQGKQVVCDRRREGAIPVDEEEVMLGKVLMPSVLLSEKQLVNPRECASVSVHASVHMNQQSGRTLPSCRLHVLIDAF